MNVIITINMDVENFNYQILFDREIKNFTVFSENVFQKNNIEVGWLSNIKDSNDKDYCKKLKSQHKKTTSVRTYRSSNMIMNTLNELGFTIDSSVVGNHHYQPFYADHTCAGEPHLNIREIPITNFYGDLNPTKTDFKSKFSQALNWLCYVIINFNASELNTSLPNNLDFLLTHSPTFLSLKEFNLRHACKA